MSMLEVRGLAVGYGKVAVLRDARLDVGSGRIVTVIGPNGAGKTTLLGALMGLLPARGDVRYDGENLADLSVEARVRRGMCLVPERRELFGDMPVEDNLWLGAFSRLRRSREAEDDLAAVYGRFPRLQERRAPLRRHAVRRRAADAGPRPGPDGAPQASHARPSQASAWRHGSRATSST